MHKIPFFECIQINSLLISVHSDDIEAGFQEKEIEQGDLFKDVVWIFLFVQILTALFHIFGIVHSDLEGVFDPMI